jgi:glycosyltransferase involved in cell wall biosynthesis
MNYKILIFSVSNYPDLGGIADHYNSHYNAIKKRKLECKCVDFFIKSNSKNLNLFTSKWFFFYDIFKLFIFISKFKPDLIHVHDPRCSIATIFPLIFNCKKIVSSHGFIFHNGEPLHKKIYFKYAKLIYSFYDKIIAVGDKDYSRIKHMNNSVLFKNPIDETKVCPKQIKKKNNFVIISRNVPHKRIDLAVDYFRKIDAKNKQLIIVTNEQISLKDLNISVEINTTSKRLTEILGFSEFLIHPSEFEGYGLVVYEAMLNGVIPILSNLDVFRSIEPYVVMSNFNNPTIDLNFNTEKKSKNLKKFTGGLTWSDKINTLLKDIYGFKI